ncbi:MAG TPA: AAA family ATPase [Steroidobacteraceae bacterium]|nr:AAA family ATPase [Steroidobacteraceae bacterium]
MQLLEREQSLADLAAWFDGAVRASGCITLVAGEAGIGKTTLLQEFAQRQGNAHVLWGACDALFTPRPLGPLHDIARQTHGRLATTLDSGARPELIFTAALDEFEQMKTLVVIEDVHWADEATLDLLKYLGRRIHRTHCMLAVTYRDDELGPQHPLRLVIGDLPNACTHRISLAPLSETAVEQLAKRAGRTAAGLYGATGGNPFFVTEVLASAGDTVPATVRDAVLARAARLASPARQIAELVCVVPGKTECWLLEPIAHPAEAALEDCLGIGMLRRHDDSSVGFRHELARRALEDSLSEQRRHLLHAKVLQVLAARSDVPVARLAHHADGARNGLQVLRYAPLAAAQAASVGSHREAAAHYQSALRYADDLEAIERALLLEALSYECYLTGDHARAFAARRSALEIWCAQNSPLKEGDALRWLSRLFWFMGNNAQADEYCGKAIAVLESLGPSPELARAHANRADLAMEAHQVDTAMESALRAIELAERLDCTEIVCDALNALGITRLIVGDTAGWADLHRMLQLALAARSQEHVARAYNDMAAMAVSRRQYEQASGYTQAGIAYCEEHDLDWVRTYMLAYRARMRFEQGAWDAASEDVEAVLRSPSTPAITRIPALRTLAHLRVRRGDPDASGPMQEARALAGPIPVPQRAGMLAVVSAEAAWLADDRQSVVREIQPVYELTRRQRDPRMNGELAAWLWRVGALQQPLPDIAEPYATEISGDWRGAAGAWHALGCPYEHACLLAWHGTETDQRHALASLERLGAAPAARLLRRQMRVRGVRRIPRGSRPSTQGHPLGLTRREAEILGLLQSGLRSSTIAKRLFVSPKTIEHHVSAILAKLGVSSRAEAVALAHGRTKREPT